MRKGTRTTMQAKANLFRTLLVLAVVLLVAIAVALFGLGLRTAETQTTTASTTTYYKVQDLGTLGGSSSYASAINNSGQVVGNSYPANGSPHAFLYDESTTPKMPDLGTLGGSRSYATGISDSGQVVGYSDTSEGEKHAFLYDANAATPKMQDLNDLIPADSGLTINEATAINTDGQIAATGYKDGVGSHALLLTPNSDSPPPAEVDKTAPTGTVSINDGASRTRTRSVTLTLSATDPSPGSGVTQMQISNTESGLSSASWEAYSTSKVAWPLTTGTGTKTVYVRYRDGASNDSAVVKDTITYKP